MLLVLWVDLDHCGLTDNYSQFKKNKFWAPWGWIFLSFCPALWISQTNLWSMNTGQTVWRQLRKWSAPLVAGCTFWLAGGSTVSTGPSTKRQLASSTKTVLKNKFQSACTRCIFIGLSWKNQFLAKPDSKTHFWFYVLIEFLLRLKWWWNEQINETGPEQVIWLQLGYLVQCVSCISEELLAGFNWKRRYSKCVL